MFYCYACGNVRGWPDGIINSQGRCEVCGKMALCSDVPSSELPDPEIPCKRCGNTTANLGTKLCNGCWEVEHRLEVYLKSELAREHVHSLLCKKRYVIVKE